MTFRMIDDTRYALWFDRIDGLRQKRSWVELLEDPYGGGREGLLQKIKSETSTYSLIPLGNNDEETLDTWNHLVEAKQGSEERSTPIEVANEKLHPALDLNFKTHPGSCWQRYLLRISDWKETSRRSIQTSSLRILRRLRQETEAGKPIKGLVVGHVQSGKTASMAGVIAMAADAGYNMVIVLSGTLENLRIQTRERLIEDLNDPERGGPRSLDWIAIEKPAPGAMYATAGLNLGTDSRLRYLVASLKNVSRLKKLIRWLNRTPARLAMMRILIIDDEADQGGVNIGTRAQRSAINKEIVNLTNVEAQAVNYVAYTATPQAIFLNEAFPESLYPHHFILSLPQSDEHFGTEQIFGDFNAGERGSLGIVNTVGDSDLQIIKTLHQQVGAPMPGCLKEATCWFLCAAAAMRVFEICKPASFLIHTSQRQGHHANVAASVSNYLAELRAFSDSGNFEACRAVWNQQKSYLTSESFSKRMPSYGSPELINEHPEFETLIPHLRELLGEISHIQLELQEGTVDHLYHRGVHICIDNCANNRVADEKEHVRLRYPVRGEVDHPTAFIVIGGSTLARGLTIENLVSTFFLRAGAQMDTLMQMGRWFGYRRKFELLPRIWMPGKTLEKFQFMTEAERELREGLEAFSDSGVNPDGFGPMVKLYPKASMLKPTSVNRTSISAVAAECDFQGSNKQLTIYHAGPGCEPKLKGNLEAASAWLSSLGPGVPSPSNNALVWKSIGNERISELLRSQDFHPRALFFSEKELFLSWLEEKAEEAHFTPWNVVVAGKGKVRDTPERIGWSLPGGVVGKVNRSRLKQVGERIDSLSIGTLRTNQDLMGDADVHKSLPKKVTSTQIVNYREDLHLGQTPQLLLYLIDAGSTPQGGEPGEREDLGSPVDLVGISIWLPGISRGRGHNAAKKSLQLPIPGFIATLEDNAGEPEDNELDPSSAPID